MYGPYSDNEDITEELCLGNGAHALNYNATGGDGWHGGYIELLAQDGTSLLDPIYVEQSGGITPFSICTQIEVHVITATYGEEVTWRIDDGELFGPYSDYHDVTESFCLESGVHVLAYIDSYGDGWHGGTIEVLLTEDGSHLVDPVEVEESGAVSSFTIAGDVPAGPQTTITALGLPGCQFTVDMYTHMGVVSADASSGIDDSAWGAIGTDGNFPDGNKVYMIDNADGFAYVTLDPVPLPGPAVVSIWTHVRDTTYEYNDVIRVWVECSSGSTFEVVTGELDNEAHPVGADGTQLLSDQWTQHSTVLPAHCDTVSLPRQSICVHAFNFLIFTACLGYTVIWLPD